MCFKRKKLNTESEVHRLTNCQHLYNHTHVQSAFMAWNNVHGFRAEDGTYYACSDMRSFGARVQNIIVKCKSKAVYDNMIEAMADTPTILDIMNHTYELHLLHAPIRGNEHPRTYQFVVPNEDYEKEFNFNSWVDFFAEER